MIFILFEPYDRPYDWHLNTIKMHLKFFSWFDGAREQVLRSAKKQFIQGLSFEEIIMAF